VLTPLRGIAAIFVVMHHSSLFFGSFVPITTTAFFENSWIWVDFFFILSGFILTYSYGNFFAKKITIRSYKKYLQARFARIYPLHLFTLVWAFAAVATICYLADGIDPSLNDFFNLKAFLPSLLLIQDLHLYKSSPLNFPAWSLSAEWCTYLLFPFVVPLVLKRGVLQKILLALFVIVTYLAIYYLLGPISVAKPDGRPKINLVADFGLLRCIAGFSAGMVLHFFYERRAGFSILKRSASFLLFCLGAIIAIHAGVNDLLVIAFFPFLLLTAAYNESQIKGIFSQSILQNLGKWSFSIYMVHAPIILMVFAYTVYKDPRAFANMTPSAADVLTMPTNYKTGLFFCGFLLTSTVAVSAFTYRFVEVPARKYLHKFSSK